MELSGSVCRVLQPGREGVVVYPGLGGEGGAGWVGGGGRIWFQCGGSSAASPQNGRNVGKGCHVLTNKLNGRDIFNGPWRNVQTVGQVHLLGFSGKTICICGNSCAIFCASPTIFFTRE
jgi:hypothetical protein